MGRAPGLRAHRREPLRPDELPPLWGYSYPAEKTDSFAAASKPPSPPGLPAPARNRDSERATSELVGGSSVRRSIPVAGGRKRLARGTRLQTLRLRRDSARSH